MTKSLSPPTKLFETGSRLKVLIGAPGSGKSTLLLWLLRQVAGALREYVLAEQQAIPLLIRVRELRDLTPAQLCDNRRLIELAVGSRDVAALMPDGWLDRQFAAGRVFLLLDGLDETEAPFRDEVLLPWLTSFLTQNTGCHAIVTSRPTGFPEAAFVVGQPLGTIGTAEYTLLDFEDESIQQYLRSWFTQVRLAQNEPSDEADRGGTEAATALWNSLERFPPVQELAQSPLLLSAICLVYHFEGGRLPDDRAVLYRLCVEGLLDRWDSQKGLRSRCTFEHKLLFCQELAAAMTSRGLRECPVADALTIARIVLANAAEATALVEHLRDRAGLVTERTPGKLSFAHLTFQEYLTAVGVRDENRQGVTIQTLAENHTDERWQEVILLFCRLAPPALARHLLDAIRGTPLTQTNYGKRIVATEVDQARQSIFILISAFASCTTTVRRDPTYRSSLLRDLITICNPSHIFPNYSGNDKIFYALNSEFSQEEMETAVLKYSGRIRNDFHPLGVNLAGSWLFFQKKVWDITFSAQTLENLNSHSPAGLRQLVVQYYCFSPRDELAAKGHLPKIWQSPLSNRPEFRARLQVEAVLLGLAWRVERWVRQHGIPNVSRNVLEHVPEKLLCRVFDCYARSPWPKDSQSSAIFIMLLSGCKSKPSTIKLCEKYIKICTIIAGRLGTLSGAHYLTTWVKFLQNNP